MNTNPNPEWGNYVVLKKKDDDLDEKYGPKKKQQTAQVPGKYGGSGQQEAVVGKKKKTKKVTLHLSDFTHETSNEILDFFNSLPERGSINPTKVRFSQDSVNNWYTKPFTANGVRVETLKDHITALKEGAIDPDSTPEIEITFVDGFIVTLSNRRLKVHRDANKPVHYKKVPFKDAFKFTADKLYENISIR